MRPPSIQMNIINSDNAESAVTPDPLGAVQDGCLIPSDEEWGTADAPVGATEEGNPTRHCSGGGQRYDRRGNRQGPQVAARWQHCCCEVCQVT